MRIVFLCGAMIMAAIGHWLGARWGWIGGVLGHSLVPVLPSCSRQRSSFAAKTTDPRGYL